MVDIANVRVEFESGCVANFTASRVSTERVRKLRFFEPRQYVSIDYARRDVLVIRVDAGAGKSSPADLIASLPPQVAAMLPPGVAEGIASGKIDLTKIDPEMIAQFAAMAGIDPAVIAQITNPAESTGGLSFSKPTVNPAASRLRLEIESFPRCGAHPARAACDGAPGTQRTGARAGDSGIHGYSRQARRTRRLLRPRCVDLSAAQDQAIPSTRFNEPTMYFQTR